MPPLVQALPTRRKLFVLAGFAALFMLARFVDLESAPFINDEPQLQLILDGHFAAHTIPRQGLEGTRGVPYGPTALWLYAPLRLLTDNVAWLTAYHVFLHCVGLALLGVAIWTSVGLETALWSLLLIGSSPYLFFYARLAWDNTFLIPLTALTLLCVTRLDRDATRVGAWLGLGLAAGLVFNLHLMALPVIAAAALVILPIAWRSRRKPRALIGFALAPLAFALTVAPYLQALLPALRQRPPTEVTTEALAHALPDTLLGTSTYLSAAGMDYILTDAMQPIVARLGPLASGPQLASIVRIVAWAWLGLSLATWRRTPRFEARPFPVVARFGVAYFLLLAVYYYLVRPYPFHPHYFMTTFWLLPFFAAWAATESQRATRSARFAGPARAFAYALQGVLALLVLCNIAFVAAAHDEISQNGGTREPHHSSTRGEVQRATQQMCHLARLHLRTRVIADLRVGGVLRPPFTYLTRHLPECAGISIDYGRAPPIVAPDVLAVAVSYAQETPRDAHLVVRMRQ